MVRFFGADWHIRLALLFFATGICGFNGLKAQNINPLAKTELVANRVISKTPFQFKLKLQAPEPEFSTLKFIDFGRTFGLGNKSIAYAYTHFVADKPGKFTFDVSHNDGLVVWVNNQKVYEKLGPRQLKIEQRERDYKLESKFTANLLRGSNQVLIKSFTEGKAWEVYIQPEGATIEFSEVKGLRLGLHSVDNIEPRLAGVSNWLVVGPLPFAGGTDNPTYGPENGFEIGTMYPKNNPSVTWTLPKVDVFADVIDPHPQWGTYYNWNYHAAGLAWAMSQLADYTGKQQFDEHAKKYCDFILEKKPFIEYQVTQLKGFKSVNYHLVNTPLLDFTAAPAMPFVYRLHTNKQFEYKKEAQELVKNTQEYLDNHQVRLKDGTFTRETPEKFTTWVDDMFMGIPFLVQSALHAQDAQTRKKYFDEAAKQVIGFNKIVWDKDANLYMHAQYSERSVKLPHWSRANGWGVFATVEVLKHLPKNHWAYKQILSHYKTHVKSIVKYQMDNGFWHNVIDHPETYEESSATAIFTLAIARGVNEGWLPKKYKKNAIKAWEAIETAIDSQGSVSKICMGTMSSEDVNYYAGRPQPNDDSHGLIGLVIAGIEMDKLLKNK